MRAPLAITYFAMLIAVIIGITAWSSEDVYEMKDNTFHQRVLGFTIDIPDNWSVIDNAGISERGDYLIILAPDDTDERGVYFSFNPVKGLRLDEFALESLFDMEFSDNINLKDEKIGDMECLTATISVSSESDRDFPKLTMVFTRIGDHFLRIIFFSYDSIQQNESMDIIKTIRYGDSYKVMTFLAVKNHWLYGSHSEITPTEDMYLLETNAQNQFRLDAADGTESLIIDDFEYPARFPAGESRDEYGYRIQYYENGRYHIDNRNKKIDVYVPDITLDISDFRLSVEMRFEGGHPLKGNGIVFRGSEHGFYLFDLSPDGFYSLYKFRGGFEVVIDKEFAVIADPYKINLVEISVSGKKLELFINDNKIRDIKLDDDLKSGFTGFYVCAGSWASFDNYCIEVM